MLRTFDELSICAFHSSYRFTITSAFCILALVRIRLYSMGPRFESRYMGKNVSLQCKVEASLKLLNRSETAIIKTWPA